ncbi:MAG: cupin domain-containing protein [Acidobacteria bacterium]|nr:cupin domain-containing protein [Acidobacteriota bacterium]
MSKPIFNIDDAEFAHELRHGEAFEAKIAPISLHLGAMKLAYNLTVVAPGKRAFPFHNHHTNEELFFIIDGQGTLRFGDQEHRVRQGDLIACPPGGPEVAHQLVNTGEGELRYLALSTTLDTDVFQYPDSRKFGVVAGRKPGMRPTEAPFAGFYAEDQKLDYWEGE